MRAGRGVASSGSRPSSGLFTSTFFSLVLPQHTRFIQQFLPTITFGNKADERYDLKRKQWGLGTREVGS